MTIKKVETKVYTEHAYCECGGEMMSTGGGYQQGFETTLYWHSCDKCYKYVVLENMYPRLVYEEVEES